MIIKKIIINNWQNYGDYMFFAGLVDIVNGSIFLESTSEKIIAYGNQDSLQEFFDLLIKKQISFNFY